MEPAEETPFDQIDDFAGFKVFKALSFSEKTFAALVQDTTNNPPQFPVSLGHVEGPKFHVGGKLTALGCKTILIEEDYKDRDYISEFSSFYAKRFRIPQPLCTRLHFFSEKLPFEGQVQSTDQIGVLSDASYLGFCVVRPTEFNRVARTVLRYPGPLDKSQLGFVTCQEKFSSHILGRKFEVYGMPFMQQDTQVGACAHAVLWMAARYMQALGHCEEILPNEINEFAKSHQSRGRRYPAHDGLVTVQMLEALDGIGLSAIEYNLYKPEGMDSKKGATSLEKALWIYNYVESGFPVIMGLGGHVVLAIGHTLNIGPRKGMQHVPSLIIHDDSVGPYLEFPLNLAPKPQEGVPISLYTLENVDGIIAIVPDSAKLKGEYAVKSVISFLKLCNQEKEKDDPVIAACRAKGIEFPDPNLCSFRNYLLKSTDFQQELIAELDGEGLPPEYVEVLLRLEYPRYIWVTEIYSDTDQEKCVGKFILDSTAARWDRSILSILLESGFCLFARQDLQTVPYVGTTGSPCKINSRKHAYDSPVPK
jgi:hypothetical protein